MEKNMEKNMEINAVLLIQNKTKNYFIKKYGLNWKDNIKNNFTIETLDYLNERNGIMDPWHDYCDDNPIYKKINPRKKENKTTIINNYFG